MIGILSVDNSLPVVISFNKTYRLSGPCKLLRHCDGSWNFNMSLSGLYTAYKQGQRVSGSINGDTFIAWSLAPELSEIVIGRHYTRDVFLSFKDVMLIRYVHQWGGNIADRKWWEGTVNGIVEDWNSPNKLISQAEALGIAWVVLRPHKNGAVSCLKKSH